MTLEEAINSRNYLLAEQKKRLLEDIPNLMMEEDVSKAREFMDALLFKLFGFGMSYLDGTELAMVDSLLKEFKYE